MGSTKRSKTKNKLNAQKQGCPVTSPSPRKGQHAGKAPSVGGGGIIGAGRSKVPEGYLAKGDKDVEVFRDFQHASLGGKVWRSQDGKGRDPPVLRSVMLSSVVEMDEPQVLKDLPKGFDLRKTHKPGCCFGPKRWNARAYAQGLSTDLSSPRLLAENSLMGGRVDFMSDFNNIKALFKANLSDSHLSFMLHRVGETVAIDQLDLVNLFYFPDYLELPREFVEFVSDVVGGHRTKVIGEGRSNAEVMSKEAFHKLLHASMHEPIKMNFGKRMDQDEIQQPSPSSDNQFLHHALLTTTKYQVLAGSNAPIFADLEGKSFPSTQTVRSHRCSGNDSGVSTMDWLDAWLDNILLACSSTVMYHEKGMKISKKQVIKTEEIPQFAKFDASICMERGEKLLEFIKATVKSGQSYWLYRAPGSCEISMYNLSNICATREPSPKPVLENWPKIYMPYFQTASLFKYSECLCDVIMDQLPNEINNHPFKSKVDSFKQRVFEKFNCGQVPQEVDVTESCNPVPSTSTSTDPQNRQNLAKKLEVEAKNLKRQLPPKLLGDGLWIIEGTEDLSLESLSRVRKCITGIYSIASVLAPTFQRAISRHAVEHYFVFCLRIILSLEPDQKRMKMWKTLDPMRRFVVKVTEGICEMLQLLLELFDRVTNVLVTNRPSWMYLGHRMSIYMADLIKLVGTEIYEKSERLSGKWDKSWGSWALPSYGDCLYSNMLALYDKALTLIPTQNQFSVPGRFLPDSKDQLISRDTLWIDANTKMAHGYLSAVRFHLSFAKLYHLIENKSITGLHQGKKNAHHQSHRNAIDDRRKSEKGNMAFTTPDTETLDKINVNSYNAHRFTNKCLQHWMIVKDSMTDEYLGKVVNTLVVEVTPVRLTPHVIGSTLHSHAKKYATLVALIDNPNLEPIDLNDNFDGVRLANLVKKGMEQQVFEARTRSRSRRPPLLDANSNRNVENWKYNFPKLE